MTEPNYYGTRDDTLIGPREDPDGVSQEPDIEPPLPGHGDYTEHSHRLRMKWVLWAIRELDRRAKAAGDKREEYHRVVMDLAGAREEVRDLTGRVKELGERCAAYEKVISSRKAYTVLEIGQVVYLPNAVASVGGVPPQARVERVHIYGNGIWYTVSRWCRGRYILDNVPASEVMEELPLIPGEPLGSWHNRVEVVEDAFRRP